MPRLFLGTRCTVGVNQVQNIGEEQAFHTAEPLRTQTVRARSIRRLHSRGVRSAVAPCAISEPDEVVTGPTCPATHFFLQTIMNRNRRSALRRSGPARQPPDSLHSLPWPRLRGFDSRRALPNHHTLRLRRGIRITSHTAPPGDSSSFFSTQHFKKEKKIIANFPFPKKYFRLGCNKSGSFISRSAVQCA